MGNVRDSGGSSPDDLQLGGGTQALDREPETGFPVQKVLVGTVIGALVIAVVVLGVYVSRQGSPDNTAKTSVSSDIYDGIPVTVKDTGNVQANHRSMRVVSARGDLSGRRELAWPADEGSAVGDARCTQNLRFDARAAAEFRPTIVICWRTSADKSVYTVAVDVANKPAMRDSVVVLDKEWNALG